MDRGNLEIDCKLHKFFGNGFSGRQVLYIRTIVLAGRILAPLFEYTYPVHGNCANAVDMGRAFFQLAYVFYTKLIYKCFSHTFNLAFLYDLLTLLYRGYIEADIEKWK